MNCKNILLYLKFSKSLKNFKITFQYQRFLCISQKTNLNKKKIVFEQFFFASINVICVNKLCSRMS